MIGWLCFITLLILVLGFLGEMQAGYGRAFGYPSRTLNWGITIPVLMGIWVFVLLVKFHLIKFWFQQ